MKKILALFILLIMSTSFALSKEKNYSLHFNGKKYDLLYSVKNKDFGGYLNEYYKHGETYNIWSEMVAIHHFPNAYSPIDRIKDFKDYLASMHVPSSLTFDNKKNSAMIDFIMIASNKMPVVLEFNVFKYEKSKKCGSVAIQYAKRYSATNTMQVEAIKKDFEKNRNIILKKVKNFKIPELVTDNIDKCISGLEIKNKAIEEAKAEEALKQEELKKQEELIKKQEELSQKDEDTNKEDENTEIINEEQSVAEKQTTGVEENHDIKKEEKETEIVKEEKEIVEAPVQEERTEDIIPVEKSVKIEEKVAETTKNEIQEEEEEKSNIKEEEKISKTVLKQEEVKAPIPNEIKEVEKTEIVTETPAKQSKKSQKSKKVKEVSYEYKNNTKDNFISKPRTKKELKQEVKQKKLEFKAKQKQAKLEAKANKKSYEIVNSNTDLIAKPRTKKELKQQTKMLKKQAKKMKKNKKKNKNK